MNLNKKYRGVIVPMVTPFTENGKIDLASAEKIAGYLVQNNVSPFILGTTGESASIPNKYKLDFVKTVVNKVSKKALVYAGISNNSFEESIKETHEFFDSGVDAVVAHLPSYYQLNEEEMLKYYETLAEKVPGPLIIYNIPSTTKMSIPIVIVEKLSRHNKIVGIKDSERDFNRVQTIAYKFKDREDFSHLIGWASESVNSLKAGADGLVPSTGNFVPKMFKNLYDAVLRNDFEEADRLQSETNEISEIYQKGRTLGQSLSGLKVMMSEINLCKPYVLLPLRRLSAEEEKEIKSKVNKLKVKIGFE